MAYLLNSYFYRDKTVQNDSVVRAAAMTYIDIFHPEGEIRTIRAEEFMAYKKTNRVMGSGVVERY